MLGCESVAAIRFTEENSVFTFSGSERSNALNMGVYMRPNSIDPSWLLLRDTNDWRAKLSPGPGIVP